MISIPYTYLIGWSDLNVWYYGTRYANGCDPSDLWDTYFTSSKYVKEFINCFGDPDIKEIRKIFKTSAEARSWEHKVLKRMKVVQKNNWINKTDNISIDPKLAGHGKAKYWLGKKGVEHCNFGKKFSEEFKNKLRGPKSESHKQSLRGPRPHVNQKGIKRISK
jgi:hypothetical protein